MPITKTTRSPALAVVYLCLYAVTASAQALGERSQEVLDRAIADSQSGRIDKSVAGSDNLVKLVPAIAPQLWQRGIAL